MHKRFDEAVQFASSTKMYRQKVNNTQNNFSTKIRRFHGRQPVSMKTKKRGEKEKRREEEGEGREEEEVPYYRASLVGAV